MLATPRLGLTLLTSGIGLDREIRWAHVTELTDPTPWLEGGEVVLTLGIGLAALPVEEYPAYIARLLHAEAAAVGFGSGVYLPQVPPALVAAAEAAGMPLFEVPAELPFIAVTKTVANRLARRQMAALESVLKAQQRMTRHAVGRGLTGLISVLFQSVRGWGLVLDASGRILTAHPRQAAEHAAGLWAEIRDLPGRGPLALTRDTPAGRVIVQSLGAATLPRGYLAVGAPARHTEAERLLINHAASLLAVELEKSREVRALERRLGETLLESALTGGLPKEQLAQYLSAFRFDVRRPLCVLLLRPRQPSANFRDLVADALDALPTPALICRRDGGVAVVLHAHADVADEIARLVTPTAGALDAGLSDPVQYADLPLAFYEAASAADKRGEGVVRFGALGATTLLLRALNRETLASIVHTLLAPLQSYDERAGGELIRSLTVFLGCDGRWDEAAAELRTHRHTLKYRLRRVEALTGHRLTSPQTRMELWLALQARRVLEEPDTIQMPDARMPDAAAPAAVSGHVDVVGGLSPAAQYQG